MAAEAVASALLGAIFQSLLPKVSYDKFLDFCRSARVHSEAKNVMKLLQSLQKVLDVAEERQFEDVAVKDWVDDLRDVAYDLEVILDEFDTFQLQKELGRARAASLFKLQFKWKFGSKVKEITRRLQDLRDRMELLDLKPVSSTAGSSTAISEGQRETDSGLFGRDAQRQKLIDLVLKNAAAFSNTDSRRLHVLAVVGLGGMGKTTLAQRVYHDLKDSPCFDMKAWVCISDRFQLMTIMENILREICGDSSGDKSLQQVHKKIEEEIQGKTLLLFLDDAWERHHTQWRKMWSLLDAAKKITVVLTTRDMQVASSSGALRNELLLLETLSEEDCFSIFQRYAFQNREIAAHPMLKDIGVQIVKKCDGSPLAAKILGSILRCESDERKWKSILHSKLLAADENSIRSILILSYHHLHMPLKRCFAFAAIFPKGYEFEEQQIVLLWMGQGFLQHSNQTELEDVGRDYFHDLLSRSFFQPSPSKTGLYVMHDLIHDLAQEVAGKTCFRLEEMMGADQIRKLSSTTRYASYAHCKYKVVEKIRSFGGAPSLQTFVHVKGQEAYNEGFSYPLIDDTVCRLCHLRVLSLRSCRAIYELPHSVTKLKHLRYLDLSDTEIEVLQDSICTLVNLQTLLLNDCSYLVKLPHDLSNLVNIRHLDISGSIHIKEMSFGLNNLKSLRTLSNFVVGKDIKHGIQQLKDLNQIKASLCISELQNVTIPGDARQAMLKEKTKLRTLTMRWTNSNVDSNFQNMTENVLEELRPPQKLEELTIEDFMGAKFPEWMGDSSFSNITSLSLSFCEKCTCLPSVGKLPTLRHLRIKAFKEITKVDSHFCGGLFPEPFSSLETLEFEDMLEWEYWFISDEIKAFPRLKRLSILCCPKLSEKLPEQLLELEELVIKDCKSLVLSVPGTSKLKSLEINGCKEVTCNNFNGWNSLNSLILKNIEAFNFQEELNSWLEELEELETDCLKLMPHISHHPSKVTRMSLLKYSELKEMPCRLKKLRLEDCLVEKLPRILLAKNSSFSLEVLSCPNLISFLDEIEFSNDNGDSHSTLVIDVTRCAALEYIPVFKMKGCCCTLVDMNIDNCGSLVNVIFPRTLRSLDISYCHKLHYLVEEENKSYSDMRCPQNVQLDVLKISSCDSLECLASSTRGKLPFRVKRLHIFYCGNLKSLMMSPLSSSLTEIPEELESLDIQGCPELKEVAECFHIQNAVQSFKICDCGSLKCLPKGLQNINSLIEFSVTSCEKLEAPGCGIVNLVDNNQLAPLETLDITDWPAGNASLLNEGGFQRINSTLTSLDITYPNTSRSVNKPILEWGLYRLVSLQRLSLKGESDSDVAYFSEKISSALLPSSLTELEIRDFKNLKYLSCHVYKNLGSLQKLFIYKCPKLESFPKGGGGLPLSLLELRISGCPKLEKRYENKKKMKAKDWSKISHVPNIQINSKSIHDIWLKNN